MADDSGAESIRFFSGVKFEEPNDDMGRFREKVHRVFSDSVGKTLKRVSFMILVGRIALNGYMNLRHIALSPTWTAPHESIEVTQDFEEHARRVSSGVCNALTYRADREACAADLYAVASRWGVDVGSQYSVSAQFVYGSERGLYCLNALNFVFLLLSSTFRVCFRADSQVGLRQLILCRKVAKRIAGFSALKALSFLSLPYLSLSWKAEWLQGIRSVYVTPVEDTGAPGSRGPRRMRAFNTVLMMVTGLGGVLLAFTALQVKVLEHQHLLYIEQRDWTWYEWYQFLNLVNIVTSIFDLGQITYSRTVLFAFGGKDGKIDVAEWEKRESYEVLTLRAAKEKFGALDFMIIAYQYDSGDLQQIMMDVTEDRADAKKGDSPAYGSGSRVVPEGSAADGNAPASVHKELIRDMRGNPSPMIILGILGAGLAASVAVRHYTRISSPPE